MCNGESWEPSRRDPSAALLRSTAFADEYRIVLFDQVGAGDSDHAAYSRAKYGSLYGYAHDVLEICRELELRDVIFVALHQRLADRRVNRVNTRREFFYATPSEVKQQLLELTGALLSYEAGVSARPATRRRLPRSVLAGVGARARRRPRLAPSSR